jgi:hypothetical protein
VAVYARATIHNDFEERRRAIFSAVPQTVVFAHAILGTGNDTFAGLFKHRQLTRFWHTGQRSRITTRV